MKCSIVIPVYNSEASLDELVHALEQVLPTVATEFEVILVNDGSRDGSWGVICRLALARPWMLGVNLKRNYGQHNALLCGIRAAAFETIVTMDDDLQHPPSEIPKLIDKLAEGYGVVYGVPRHLPHSFVRNLLSKVTKRLVSQAMGIKNIRDISAFRAFHSDLRDAFINYQSTSLVLDVLLSWGTTQFASIQVDHEPRRLGISNYTFSKLFDQALLVVTGFSTGPLRLASWVGFGFTLFGLAVLGYVLLTYFLAGSLPGFPFLASIIAVFSGAQLFALGIIGEYLARMFNRSMERPTYVVGETTRAIKSSEEAIRARHGW